MAGYDMSVASEVKSSQHLHPRLIEAAIALNENRLDVAERLLKPHLSEDPFDVRAMRMLAELAARIGRWRDAENLLRRAVELAPGFLAAKTNLALVLGRTGRPAEALELLDDIFDADSDETGVSNLRAATLGKLGDFDEAIRLYQGTLEKAPNQPRVWLSYGHMLKTVGRQPEGVAAYRKALSLDPTLGEAWWSLANLKTVKLDGNDIGVMEQALEMQQLSPEDRFHFGFALGKALHDAGEPDRAFAHYREANALRRTRHPYDADQVHRTVNRCIERFTTETLEGLKGGCDAADPIFIVGLPRAGSTLIEQILSSHSLVEGTAELPDLPAVARKTGPYPNGVLKASPEERAALGADYLDRASVQRRTGRPYFVDKLPNNWLYVPFIRLVLPNAKIIDARRHPLGCCFSNFRQHFARGQDFTYDLEDLGR